MLAFCHESTFEDRMPPTRISAPCRRISSPRSSVGSCTQVPGRRSAHAVATMALSAKLGNPFHFGENGPGGWWLLNEPELHFEADVLVPDIAGWRRERMPTCAGRRLLITLRPIGSARCCRRRRKKSIARRSSRSTLAKASRHAWLVNPLLQTLEVLRLESERWSLVAVHEGASKCALSRSTPSSCRSRRCGRSD